MKLSEAIRLGAMLKPQAFGNLTDHLEFRSNGPLGVVTKIPASCAMQAAYEAVGAEYETSIVPKGTLVHCRGLAGVRELDHDETLTTVRIPVSELVDEMRQATNCPQCGKFPGAFWQVIPHLNDSHRWTRERIADWVETIENQQEAAKEQPQAAEVQP